MTITVTHHPTSNSHEVAIDGGCTVAIIPDSESAEAIEKFVAICRERETQLAKILLRYEVAIGRNGELHRQGKLGQDWPAFRERDQIIGQICRQAGIKV